MAAPLPMGGTVSEKGLQSIVTALRRPESYVGHAREAVNLARCVVQFPMGVIESALTTGTPRGDRVRDIPVILVHGFGHNRSGWFFLDRRLRQSGFSSVHTINYSALTNDIPTLARRLAERVAEVQALTGAPKVNIVGHSLGGIVLRWYVQELGGHEHVDTAITIASPHGGSDLARFARGPVAPQLAPGSRLLRRLDKTAVPSAVRWIAYYSNLDVLVRGSAAKITAPALRATNILIKDQGHMSIMVNAKLTASIVHELERSSALAAAS